MLLSRIFRPTSSGRGAARRAPFRQLCSGLTFWPFRSRLPFESDVDPLDPRRLRQSEREDASEESGRDVVPSCSSSTTCVLTLRHRRRRGGCMGKMSSTLGLKRENSGIARPPWLSEREHMCVGTHGRGSAQEDDRLSESYRERLGSHRTGSRLEGAGGRRREESGGGRRGRRGAGAAAGDSGRC